MQKKLGADVHSCDSLLDICKTRKVEQVEMVRFLLDNGLDVNGNNNDSSLTFCLVRGFIKIAKLLLERGSLVSERDLVEVARMVKGGEEGEEVLELARMIIARGAKVVNNDRALFNAVSRANFKMVKLLLENGASV